MSVLPLHPYQAEAVEAVKRELDAGRTRPLVVAPTGSGKTWILAELVAHFLARGQRALLAVHREELVDQLAERVRLTVPDAWLGIEQAARRADPLSRVVVGSVPTLAPRGSRRLDRLGRFDVVFLDEAHHAPAPSFQALFRRLGCFTPGGPPLLGFSVGPDTTLCLRRADGQIRLLTIGQLAQDHAIPLDGVVPVSGLEIQSLTPSGIAWKPVTAIHRYRNRKRTWEFSTDLGRSIVVTDDHSLFSATSSGALALKRAGTLKPGDYLVVEDHIAVENPVSTVEVWRSCDPPATLIGGVDHELARRLCTSRKKRYKRLRGRHGPCLRLDEALAAGLTVTKDHRLYSEGSSYWFPAVIPTQQLAWLVGYFAGNGWVHGGTVSLAAPDRRVPQVLTALRALPGPLGIRIRQLQGAVNLRIANVILGGLFRDWFGGQRAPSKTLPELVFSWDDTSRRALVQGLLDSDGYQSPANEPRNRQFNTFTTTSATLALQLRYLLTTLGIHAGTQTQWNEHWAPRQTRPHPRRVYRLRISTRSLDHTPLTPKQRPLLHRYQKRLGMSFGLPIKIRRVRETLNVPEVFDLTVADTENFFANHFLVHNTATPRRGDGIGLGHVFQSIAVEIPLPGLIANGYLCPLRGFSVETTTALDCVRRRAGDFDDDELSEAVNTPARNALAVRAYQAHAAGHQAVVFCVDRRHVHAMHGAFLASGLTAATLTGDLPHKVRVERLDAFRRGALRVLVNCGVLVEGIDVPPLSAAVLSRPTSSPLLFAQMLGRILRTSPGKRDAVAIDLVDNTRTHRLQTLATLAGLPPKIRFQGERLFDIAPRIERVLADKPWLAIAVEADRLITVADILQASHPVDILYLDLPLPDAFARSRLAWVAIPPARWVLSAPEGTLTVRQTHLAYEVGWRKRGETETTIGASPTLEDAVALAERVARTYLASSTLRMLDRRATWRHRPPSDEQKAKLDRYRIPYTSETTAGDASLALSRRFAGLTTPTLARQLGHQTPKET